MTVSQSKGARRKILLRYKRPHMKSVADSIAQERFRAAREIAAKKRK